MKPIVMINKEIEQIQILSDELEDAKTSLSNALQELADDSCSYHTGDVVDILGYSHYGKKGVIEKITKGNPLDKYDFYRSNWTVQGFVLKKDGTKGKFDFSFDESDLNRKLKQETENER